MACNHLEKVDPRVKRTRKLLEDAMAELLNERDYDSISVQDVAERATVNRATFYAHYADKQALLESLILARFHEFLVERFPELPELTVESLGAMFTAILEFVDKSMRSCPSHEGKGLDHLLIAAVQDDVRDLFSRWLAMSPDNPFKRHKPELVAVVLSTSLLGSACHWTRTRPKPNLHGLALALVAMLTHADAA